jgi:hypothetical protein
VSAINLDEALQALAAALNAADGERGRDARMRAAREVLVGCCAAVLGTEPTGRLSVTGMIRLAMEAPDRPARRACAVLVVRALAMPGLVPPGSAGDVCALVEGALRDVLLRCGYPFGGTIEEKIRVLERLHAKLGELMQPMEPTFPNWIQGLHTG